MATSKSGGSTQNCRDSRPKFRGVKKFGGEVVEAGQIIVRQCGTKYHAGYNVGQGGDSTLFALNSGNVKFHKSRKGRMFVSVL